MFSHRRMLDIKCLCLSEVAFEKSSNHMKCTNQKDISSNSNNKKGTCRSSYMRQYQASKNSPEKKAQHNKYKKNYKASKASVEQKAKHSEYKKKYRASLRLLQNKMPKTVLI